MRRNLLYGAGAAVVACLTVGTYYAKADTAEPQIATRPITRGNIIQLVSATGTLETVTSVEVGTQVSGTMMSLNADFNSIVHKGQIVARLDPSLFETEVAQARANLTRSESEVERLQVMSSDAQAKLQRATDLSEKQVISSADLEAAVFATRTAAAQIRAAQAAVTQSQASLQQAQLNLAKTVIASPIDGIVVARNVDIGQTVAASMSAPTLFVIAADLSRMQVNTSIDESDVGMIHEGQSATFRVGAFPGEEFPGTVRQLRLNPTVAQNVVTYTAVIDVMNEALKLKPGMTATVAIEIARKDNVLRAPNAALQYRPTTEALAVLSKDLSTSTTLAKTARQIWAQVGGGFIRVPVETGLSDGTNTELLAGDLVEGTKVVTGVTTGVSQQQARTAGSADPFSSMQQGRGFNGGPRP
jgi:HlyD family secretion protein